MQNDPIVIVGLARTPMGAFQGELKGFASSGVAGVQQLFVFSSLWPGPWPALRAGNSRNRKPTGMRCALRAESTSRV